MPDFGCIDTVELMTEFSLIEMREWGPYALQVPSWFYYPIVLWKQQLCSQNGFCSQQYSVDKDDNIYQVFIFESCDYWWFLTYNLNFTKHFYNEHTWFYNYMKKYKVLSILRRKKNLTIGRKIKGNKNNKILVSLSRSSPVFETLAHRFVDAHPWDSDLVTLDGAWEFAF